MPSKLRNLRNVLLAAAVGTIPLVEIAVGQTRPAGGGGLNTASFYGKETFQGVSVRDSLDAIKKLEDAARMERLGDWNKAADWYQEVLEKYGQYVVPSGTDEKNHIRQYTGVERPVHEQLARWPKAGLDAYRNRYGAVASAMLQQSRPDDRETATKVLKLYFVTEAGKLAGVRLVDLLLEGGEFAEASRVGDRLLDWHPDLVVERPKVLFRTALAYHLAGDAAKAKQRAEQLKAKHAGAVGTLFGKDVVLADALDRLLQVSPPVAVATAGGSVRYNPGGDESRSQISGATGRPGARLGGTDLAPPPQATRQTGYRADMEIPMRRGAQLDTSGAGGGPGVMPVADGDELFFQDGSRVYAVSVQSGVPLPGWTQSYPNTGGQYTINASSPAAANRQHTLTLTDDAVLGVMGFSERQANFGQQVFGSDRGTRLVSLDRASGKERWVARPNRITEENLRVLDFSGSPLVVGANVYVMGRGGKNMTAEDCYVLCFDVNTGAYKWSCFVASSNNAAAYTGQVSTGDTLAHLAYSSGRVYAVTNTGACAAIDAYSGTISWLNIYPRDASFMDQGMGGGWRGIGRPGMMSMGGSSGRPWEANPVVVRDGRVFVAPSDSKHLFVYDAGTGAEVRRISTADLRQKVSSSSPAGDTALPSVLLAVEGNHAFLSGGRAVFCIDWSRPGDDLIVWHKSFNTPIRGRGFVTADSVYVCTASGVDGKPEETGALHRLTRYGDEGRPSGKWVQSYPPKRDWGENEGPGNVIVTGEQVVIASAKRVNVYADLVLARKRLEDDVAAAPNDPAPRLRFAEVMFVAQEYPDAMKKLDETVELLGGVKSMRSGPARDHLFNDCVTFAHKLQKDARDAKKEAEADVASITRLYDLAGAAADGDSQQVNYRMSRARFHRDFVRDGSLTAAVGLYQEVLTSDRLRIVPFAADDDGGGTTQAAIVAERMIGEVKKIRPQAYEAVEKLAGEALEAAGSDPARLKKVAESYPNATAASKAMRAAAEAYEAAGDRRMAVYTLRQAYDKYAGTADNKAALLESMARNYLAMPDRTADRVDTAAARLSAIVKLGGGANPLNKPLKLAGDKVLADAGVSVNDALKALQGFKADAVTARLPEFRLSAEMTQADWAKFQQEKAEWIKAGSDPAKRPKLPDGFAPRDQWLVIPGVAQLVKPPTELGLRFARHDRVVAWANGTLQIFPVGSAEPVGRSADLTAPPKNVAWLNDRAALLAWGGGEVVMLGADDAKRRWRVDLKTLPKIEVVTGGQTDEPSSQSDETNADRPMPGVIGPGVIRGRRVNFNGRWIVNPQQAMPAPQPAAPAVESIAQVKPVDDKVIVSTTAGQLFAIRTSDGGLAWHTRLSPSAPLSRVAATDDFTVVKVDEPATTQLVVVDTLTGQLVRRIPFPNEGGAGNPPVNFALSPDGMLVWTQQDRLCGKDLFEPKREPNYEIVAGQEPARGPGAMNIQIQADGQVASPVYAGAANPDQLLISEGRILVVTMNGAHVAVHSLETGRLLDIKTDKDAAPAPARLSTQGDATKAVADWTVALHLVGSKLFISSQRGGPICFDLDNSAVWTGTVDRPTSPANLLYREPIIGQDYFVLVNRPLTHNQGNPNPDILQPHAYGRHVPDPKTGRESGKLVHSPTLRDPSGILDIQGVDGGFYYLTGDKKLHFARGGKQ